MDIRCPLSHEIDGGPPSAPVPSIALDIASFEDLTALRREAGVAARIPSREQVAWTYARSRGRISTTEFASILGVHRTNIGSVLQGLERLGELKPSRPNRRGAGFYYRHIADGE